MVRTAPLIALALTASCAPATGQDDAIKACEAYIKKGLEAPTTFRMSSNPSAIYIPAKNPDRLRVGISYEAQNAFGTLVSNTEFCDFSAPDGKLVSAQKIAMDAARPYISLPEYLAATKELTISDSSRLPCCTAPPEEIWNIILDAEPE